MAQALASLKAGRPKEAEAPFRRVLEHFPQCWPIRNEWGNLLLNLARPVEAEEALRRVVQEAPEFTAGWVNWANSLVALERRREALAAYQRALVMEPSLAAARYNLGLVQLSLEEWTAGWANYEARWECELAPTRRRWKQPQWDGAKPLRGRSILVHAEQGLGDTLQFCRYLRPLLRAGAAVTFEVQAPLVSLLRESFPDVSVLPKGTPLTETDWHCPLLSLPGATEALGTRWEAEVPYLLPAPEARERWRERLSHGEGRKIGLVWSANVRHWRGFVRNVGPGPFARALEGLPVQAFALMKELREEDGVAARRWPNLGPLLQDFAETAAVVANLDLVLTVDTSVAHLAGALGKPVWLWLPFGADWRWLERPADSPFYPTARLFRQAKPGDWAGVAERVHAALETWGS